MAGDGSGTDGAASNGPASDDAADDEPATTDDGVAVREATEEDLIPVLNVLDAAMLDTEGVGERVAAGDALVAVEEGRVLGALVLAGERIDVDESSRSRPPTGSDASGDVDEETSSGERNSASFVHAVAVRRARRGRGIGTALVAAAAAERTRLVAEFDGRNRAFYRSLDFEIERIGPDRFRGRRRTKP